MSAAADLYALLRGHGLLTAVVGSGDDARIYPVTVPNGKDLPAIAYRRSNTEYVQVIHGPPIASDVTWDVICGAEEPIDAETLGDIVEGISGLEFVNRIDDFDPETGIYANVITVRVLSQ